MDKENKLILYKDEEGRVSVNTRFADEDVWLTQQQLAEIYCTTKQNVSQHIDNILADGELEENRTVKNFLTVRQEGKRQVQRDITYYNLDMIIALGYRVQSPIAVRFRRWATQRLHEYIQKGFTMDDERLKQGSNRYFKELLQRINTKVTQLIDLYSQGVMPVRRRKYFEKNEGLAKCISSAICAAGLSVWRSSIFIRVMRARSIQSLAVVPLVCRMTVLRYRSVRHMRSA